MHRRGPVVKKSPMKYLLPSWEELYSLTRRVALAIHDSGFRPEILVAIARGGLVPGRILADYLNILDVVSFRVEHYRGTVAGPGGARVRYPLTVDLHGRNVLLVDDVSDSGETFDVALEHLEQRGASAALRTAVICHKRTCPFVPDYWGQEVVDWRWITYPWAVIEDIGALVESIPNRPTSAEDLANLLEREYRIRVPEETLGDVLTLLRR